MKKQKVKLSVDSTTQSPFNDDSIKILLSTAKAEYDNEHNRTGIIDTKVSISLPIVSAFVLALVQQNNFKAIFALPSYTFLLLLKPSILFLTYTGALFTGLISVYSMTKVILTREYKTLCIRDLYDEDILKSTGVAYETWIIKLYCESTEHNKNENDIRTSIYRRGWKSAFVALILFVIFSILSNLFL